MSTLDEINLRLDKMLRQTLAGKTVPFDQWQNLLDDWQEEPEECLDNILQQHGLTLSELAAQAESARAAFLAQLKKFGLSLENRFALCQALCNLAADAPSDELLRLYCDIVEDGGYLLDLDRADCPEAAVSWLYGKADADRLYTALTRRAQLAARFQAALNQAKKITPPLQDCSMEDQALLRPLYRAYAGIYPVKGCGPQFLDNLAGLLHLADTVPALASIKPLFLYRMLTRHQRRIQTSEEMRFDFFSLWNRQTYRFEENNGKNYAANINRLRLFAALCQVYAQDGQVDVPLCVFGFDQLSNLGEFYRIWSPEPPLIPFEPSLSDLLETSLFTCFEHGDGDNVMMADSGLTSRAVERFRCGEDPRRVRALEQISGYMNQHLDELIRRFSGASSVTVKELCRSILECSGLSEQQKPKNAEEISQCHCSKAKTTPGAFLRECAGCCFLTRLFRYPAIYGLKSFSIFLS